MAYLVIREKDRPVSRVPLTGTVTLGRALDCDICLRDAAASVRHCCVEPANDLKSEWSVVDLNSRNGTRMDHHRVDRKLLADGDTFAIGETRVQFHSTGFVDQRPTHPELEFPNESPEPELAQRSSPRSRPPAKAASPFTGDVKVKRIRPKIGTPRTLAFVREPAQPIPQPTVDLEAYVTNRRWNQSVIRWAAAIVLIIFLALMLCHIMH